MLNARTHARTLKPFDPQSRKIISILTSAALCWTTVVDYLCWVCACVCVLSEQVQHFVDAVDVAQTGCGCHALTENNMVKIPCPNVAYVCVCVVCARLTKHVNVVYGDLYVCDTDGNHMICMRWYISTHTHTKLCAMCQSETIILAETYRAVSYCLVPDTKKLRQKTLTACEIVCISSSIWYRNKLRPRTHEVRPAGLRSYNLVCRRSTENIKTF